MPYFHLHLCLHGVQRDNFTLLITYPQEVRKCFECLVLKKPCHVFDSMRHRPAYKTYSELQNVICLDSIHLSKSDRQTLSEFFLSGNKHWSHFVFNVYTELQNVTCLDSVHLSKSETQTLSAIFKVVINTVLTLCLK